MATPEMVYCKEDPDVEPVLIRYDPWLLDDHPLRSHPTQCIPGLGSFIADWYISVQKRWAEALLRVGCLLLACLAAFHVLRVLPSPAARLSRQAGVPSAHTIRRGQVACPFPDRDPRSNALAQSIAAGCEGFRTDLWLHENQLLIGRSSSGPKAASNLRFHLDSLLKQLEPQATSAGSQTAMSADHIKNDPNRTFILALDAKSRFHELYPRLVSQLDSLRQRGYLGHWNGAEMIQGPVTVVVTGEPVPSSDCSSYSYADVFWSTNGDISPDVHDYLFPICAV